MSFSAPKTKTKTKFGRALLDRHITTGGGRCTVEMTYFGEMQEGFFQEVFGATDVLSDSVGRVVTATESRPFLGTQTSPVVATTWVCACIAPSKHT